MIEWQCKSFYELSNEELYKIIQLRIEVFSLEQNVIYQDCDNKDLHCFHITGFENNQLMAYSRIIPPGIAYEGAASIGRVVTSHQARGKAIGKKLFEKSLEQVYKLFGQIPLNISAQAYLVKFYESFSFIQEGNIYIEDSIPHIHMIRTI
jgi:ElaA protein